MANTLIPFLPVPPEVFAPAPFAHLYFNEPSVYNQMNISRIHTQEEFKKSFKDAIKILHPDKGGDQEAFSRVKNMKRIME